MKIPDKIRIGCKNYIIKKVRTVSWLNNSIVGNINYSASIIKIKKYKDKREMEQTFFHEMAHGLMKEMEFNHPQITKFRSDEVFTQELGLNLRKTFLDLLDKQEKKK